MLIKCVVSLLTDFILVSFIAPSKAFSNNACPKFEDYANFSVNENCFYNPDMAMQTPDLITKYIGEYRCYRLVTEDGYILHMFRIPQKNPKGVILLQHALTVDSRMWVSQGNESLAFYLWNAGYDIWLNNQRGTLFSKEHTFFPNDDPRYWDYSFHEVGYYDIPVQISTIKKYTSRKVIFIGHSQGSTSGLIYGCLRPEEAQNSVETFVLMATGALFKHTTSPLIYLVSYRAQLEGLVNYWRLNSVLAFLPTEPFLKPLIHLFPFVPILMNVLSSAAFGWTPQETDPAILNLDVQVYLKDFSFKSIIHYVQLIEAKTRFQMFDYGEEENLQRYNSRTAPLYPLGNFSVPVFFISGEKDSITTVEDIGLLIDMLPVKIHGHVTVPFINHLQFFIGQHRTFYFENLLKMLDKISNKN